MRTEFVTGNAGTGKTTLIKQRIEKNPKDSILCASTGIAAINLNTITIHSLLRFFDLKSMTDAYTSGKLLRNLRNIIDAGYSNLVLDEMSMFSAEQLDILCLAILEANSTFDADLGLVLAGDFLQLPAIKAKMAFESRYWDLFDSTTLKLTKIWRQTDENFLNALNYARAGDGASCASILINDCKFSFSLSLDDGFKGTTILSKNDEVRRFNQLRLMKINSPELIERKIIKGISLSEWEKQIPDEQRYKVGAYVMLLANKYDYLEMPPEMIFANGDTGLIKEKQDNGYIVELVRNKEEVLVERIIRHNTRLLNPDKQEREEIKARYNYDVQQVKIGGQTLYSIGQVEYMPMSLAWASTVHKCLWEDEYILLSDGLRKLKDVSIGSWTRDRNGVAVKITGKAKSHKRAFRVETKLGHSLICSWDHRLLTKEGFKPIEMLTKSDRKLANTKRKGNGDKLFIPEVIVQGFPVDLPTSYKTSRGTEIITPAKLDEQTAWMIGALIGDGCYTDQRDGTIEFNNSDEFLQELMTEAWTSFGLNIGRYEREGNSKVYTTSKQFRNWLHAVGLEYTTAERKSIPACILTASLAIRRMFLRGLFDTDGSVNQKQGRVSFTTASKQLCREVHLLLHSVGVISGRFEIGARNHRVEFSGISLRNFVDVGFYKKCKSQKLQVALERQMNSNKTNLDYAVKGVWDYIIEIEDLGIDLPMIDLEVEEPNEFIVGGVVSHNSQGLSLDLVQIDMRNHFFSMAGMSYVAMSRCRTVEGMKIVGNQELMARRCKIDSKVKRFI